MADDFRPTVKKIRRYRSLERQRYATATTVSQPTNIIHTTIRPFSNITFINNKSLERHNDNHLVTDLTTHSRLDEIQKLSTSGNYIDWSRKIRRSISLGSLPQNHRSASHRSQNSQQRYNNSNRIIPQQDANLIQTINSSKSSKQSFTITQPNIHADRMDIIREHHRDRKKKKKCLRLCIILCLLIGFLVIITIVTVLTVILTKPKTKTIRPTNVGLRWYSNGTTVAGVSSVSGTAANSLNSPFSLAIDYKNTLYITDYSNHRIQSWLAGASTGTTVAGLSNGTYSTSLYGLVFPAGILLDSDSNFYIADSGNSRVLFWPKDSTSGRIVAGNGTVGSANNELAGTSGLSCDWNSNTLYVADYNNHRIMRYLSNATSGDIVAGGHGGGPNSTQLYYPTSVYFESWSNSLLIVNYLGSTVVRWVLGDNSWTIVAGSANSSAGSSSTLFQYPFAMTLDPMGNMYVADSNNNRIQLFLSTQSVGTTIAGVTNIPGSNSTLLTVPYGLALDNQLNLYVADTGNHRIQKFTRY